MTRPGELLVYGIDVLRIQWNSIESLLQITSSHQGSFQLFERYLIPPASLEQPSPIIISAYSSNELWGQSQRIVELHESQYSSPLPYFSCKGSCTIEIALQLPPDVISFRLQVTVYEFDPKISDWIITCTGRLKLRPAKIDSIPPESTSIASDPPPPASIPEDSRHKLEESGLRPERTRTQWIGRELGGLREPMVEDDSDFCSSSSSLPETYSTVSLPMPTEWEEQERFPLSRVITKPDVHRTEELRESRSVQTDLVPFEHVHDSLSSANMPARPAKVNIPKKTSGQGNVPLARKRSQPPPSRDNRTGGRVSLVRVVLKAEEAPVPRLSSAVQSGKPSRGDCRRLTIPQRSMKTNGLDYSTLIVPEPALLQYKKAAN